MKIKILKSSSPQFWYAAHIGQTFDAVETAGDYKVKLTDGNYSYGYVEPADCEVLVPVGINTVLHAGKEYEIPSWANFLSCDGTGKPLFGWAEKPEYRRVGGYYASNGQREILKEYTHPLPAGAFVTEVVK